MIDQARHMRGQAVEAVAKSPHRRRVGVAEADIIRRDHMETVGQQRDQVAIHVAAGGKTMQQDDGRRRGIAGLAVEDVLAIDRGGTIAGRVHGGGIL